MFRSSDTHTLPCCHALHCLALHVMTYYFAARHPARALSVQFGVATKQLASLLPALLAV